MTNVKSLVMWSCFDFCRYSVAVSSWQLHITRDGLQPFQPIENRRVGPPSGYVRVWTLADGTGTFEGLTLRFEIDHCVTIRCFDASVSEPMANCNEINPRA